jgi:hypothetical protein
LFLILKPIIVEEVVQQGQGGEIIAHYTENLLVCRKREGVRIVLRKKGRAKIREKEDAVEDEGLNEGLDEPPFYEL